MRCRPRPCHHCSRFFFFRSYCLVHHGAGGPQSPSRPSRCCCLPRWWRSRWALSRRTRSRQRSSSGSNGHLEARWFSCDPMATTSAKERERGGGFGILVSRRAEEASGCTSAEVAGNPRDGMWHPLRIHRYIGPVDLGRAVCERSTSPASHHALEGSMPARAKA